MISEPEFRIRLLLSLHEQVNLSRLARTLGIGRGTAERLVQQIRREQREK